MHFTFCNNFLYANVSVLCSFFYIGGGGCSVQSVGLIFSWCGPVALAVAGDVYVDKD